MRNIQEIIHIGGIYYGVLDYINILQCSIGSADTITWYSVKKQNDRSELGCEIGVIVAVSLTVFALVLDIPSAIMGGKKIYVDEFPPTVTLQYFQFVKTESEYLISFKNFNSDKYEKNAKYCISYTALTKNVLNIEKVGK